MPKQIPLKKLPPANNSAKHRKHFHGARGRYPHLDPLAEVEAKQNRELPGKNHLLAEKPTKPLKRARGLDEIYRPMHR